MQIDKKKLLQTAKNAAIEAGKIQMESFGKIKQISYKANEFDLVTNVDKACEEKIITEIKTAFPNHSFLGEEGGLENNNGSDFIWIIDPLDGTTNYTHDFPQFAVSIGLFYKNEPFLGVIYDPFKKEMFSAVEGMGAFLNETAIKVSPTKELSKSLMATGFPYSRSETLEQNLKYFREFLYLTQAIRRPGSASLDMCYVACGRLDGFWEMGLSPWDVAAGYCIIKEAGGKVTNFDNDKYDIYTKNVIASNGLLNDDIKKVIHSVQKS